MAKEKITGRWLIDSMDVWDREFIDAEVRGFFEFGDKHLGSFQFGYIQGEIDYRIGERGGKPAVEFSWNGRDEMDPAQGRGWLVHEGDELKGMFCFHLGDESGIVLKRAATPNKGGGGSPALDASQLISPPTSSPMRAFFGERVRGGLTWMADSFSDWVILLLAARNR